MADRRTAAKLIRFRPDELASLTERARACGRTPARFIREAALGAVPKPRQHAGRDPLLRELARIGRTVDQLSRLAAEGQDKALADSLRAALDAHLAAVRCVLGTSQVPGPERQDAAP